MTWVTDTDRQWVKEHHPDLAFRDGLPLVLAGTLKFDAIYDQEGRSSHGERIEDAYKVEIRFETSEFSSLPQVYERGGRIDEVAQKQKLDRIELHINPSGAACLCVKFKEKDYFPNGFNLPDFFLKLVIPFFYAQSYYKEHKSWPWGDYSHGDLGYLEGYGEISEPATAESVLECIELLKKYGQKWAAYEQLLRKKGKLKVHRYFCCCGSGRKARKCHPKVFKGLQKLQEDIKTLSIEI